MWAAQLGGTAAIAVAVYYFLANAAPLITGIDAETRRYALYAVVAAGVPALGYLRGYKRVLDQDLAAARARGGIPEPGLRRELLRRLAVGGALCELPLAVGALALLAGCEPRTFVGAAMVTVVLRLSYRPFTR